MRNAHRSQVFLDGFLYGWDFNVHFEPSSVDLPLSILIRRATPKARFLRRARHAILTHKHPGAPAPGFVSGSDRTTPPLQPIVRPRPLSCSFYKHACSGLRNCVCTSRLPMHRRRDNLPRTLSSRAPPYICERRRENWHLIRLTPKPTSTAAIAPCRLTRRIKTPLKPTTAKGTERYALISCK